MPEIGDTRPAPKKSREQQLAENRLKNERRKAAKAVVKHSNKSEIKHAKFLRSKFGGAFGRAPESVKKQCTTGIVMEFQDITEGETNG